MRITEFDEPLPVDLSSDDEDYDGGDDGGDDLIFRLGGTREPENSHDEKEEAPFFADGPVYLKRYEYVLNLLADERWKRALRRIVDVGANDCDFLFRLRNSFGLRYFREAIALDIDEHLLEASGKKTAPLSVSSLVKEHKRCFFPLDVYHMCGNIGVRDERLDGVDVVVGIEVIEHLERSALYALPENVFGHMKPKLAVFTTPNKEFNALFPNFKGPFRHWDHKFEWTRAEFQEWAINIVRDYPEYDVDFDGVGEAPDSVRNGGDFGFCSQIAVFKRKDFVQECANGDHSAKECISILDPNMNLVKNHEDGRYKIVIHNHHPFDPDHRTMEERAFDAVSNHVIDQHRDLLDNDLPPRIYCSTLRDALESSCYDDYGDPYDIDDQSLGSIVASKVGYQKGEDEQGVYITLTEDHWIHDYEDGVSDDPEQLDFVNRNEDHYGGDGDRRDVANEADIQENASHSESDDEWD